MARRPRPGAGRPVSTPARPATPDLKVQRYEAESDRLFAYAALIEAAGGMVQDFAGSVKEAALVIAGSESGCYDPSTCED